MAASWVPGDDVDDVMSLTPEELDDYIRSRLGELGFQQKFADTLSDIKSRLENEERETNDVMKLFDNCEEMLEKLESDLNRCDTATDSENSDVILVGSDDGMASTRKRQRKDVHRPRSVGDQITATVVQQPQSTTDIQRRLLPVLSSGSLSQLTAGKQDAAATNPSYPPIRAPTVLNQPLPKLSELAVGMKLYAKKIDEVWYKGTLVDIVNAQKPMSDRKFKIKFDDKGMKSVGSKSIAFTTALRENIMVGTRVIALYLDENDQSSFYAGIIAEPPSIRNNNRFLVFFDDGYAQYCQISAMHQVCDQSVHVWEDIHPDSQDFIRSYLQQYPERPMVRLQAGQVVQTEWNGKWYPAQVVEVDASLVKMYFSQDQRTEWIYRGSTRLEPLYTELANAEASKLASCNKVRRRSNLNIKSQKRPFVEYTRGPDEDAQRKVAALLSGRQPLTTSASSAVSASATLAVDNLKKQATARKSTGGAQKLNQGGQPRLDDRTHHASSATESEHVDLTVDDDSSLETDQRQQQQRRYSRSNSAPSMAQAENCSAHGEMKTVVPSNLKDLAKMKFVRHTCCRDCLHGDDNPAKFKGHNPLCIPMEFGWNRQIAKYNVPSVRRAVFYIAPCRRRLRNEMEVDKYLVMTNSRLTIDLFCFDPELRTDREFCSIKTFCDIKDLSYTKENVAVPCVNGLQRDYPDYVEYSNQRIPAPGVNLNLDEEFLTGCDCTDGCRDRNRCRCMRLTIEESKVLPLSLRGPKPGYQHRRLPRTLFTGIYECNSRCKCDSRCANRVVQNGLTLRLQVFRTEKRGWGLRCLNDIPAGGFICIYAGQLLNDEGANEDGKQYGDEYLAELDLIEVVEQYKEDYESEVEDPEKDSVAMESSSSGSEFEPNTNHDSDSTYSGARRRSKRTAKHTPSKKDRQVCKGDKAVKKTKKEKEKDVLSRKTDKSKKVALAAKMTAAWVDSITISDDDNVDNNDDEDIDVDEPKNQPSIQAEPSLTADNDDSSGGKNTSSSEETKLPHFDTNDACNDDDKNKPRPSGTASKFFIGDQPLEGSTMPSNKNVRNTAADGVTEADVMAVKAEAPDVDAIATSKLDSKSSKIKILAKDFKPPVVGTDPDIKPTTVDKKPEDFKNIETKPASTVDVAHIDGKMPHKAEAVDVIISQKNDSHGNTSAGDNNEPDVDMIATDGIEVGNNSKTVDVGQSAAVCGGSEDDHGTTTSSVATAATDSACHMSASSETNCQELSSGKHDDGAAMEVVTDNIVTAAGNGQTPRDLQDSVDDNHGAILDNTADVEMDSVDNPSDVAEAVGPRDPNDTSDAVTVVSGCTGNVVEAECLEGVTADDASCAKDNDGISKTSQGGGGGDDAETSAIMITELTSLNTDNIEIESDDNDDHSIDTQQSKTEQEPKKQTRISKQLVNSQMSRFRNLPDPKSQQPVSKSASKEAPAKISMPISKPPALPNKKVRTRALFGEEYCYIMDAKSVGNLGRYLNHSCDPNVFVQNVFVDTHDLRFPWVAFFALHHIKAGTELTWDYNYTVGSVVDKTLYCYCGAAECRGRLL